MKWKVKSIKEGIIKIIPLILIVNFFVIVFYYSVSYVKGKSIQNMLITIEPIFLTVNFSLLVITLLLNLKDIRKVLKPVKKKSWIILLFIFLLGLILRMYFTPSTHRVFFDEDIYLDIGKQILTEGKGCLCNYGDSNGCYECTMMKWPNAYPFTVAVSFLFFGISEPVAFNLNIFLGSLSIILIFLIGYMLSKKVKIGLYSALLFALIPIHIMWSATTASEPVFVFYGILAIFAFLLSIKLNTWKSNLFAISSLALASQVRPESGLVIGLAALLILLFDKKLKVNINSSKFLVSWIILLVFITPYVLHTYHSAKTDPWGAKGEKFGLEFAKNNIPTNAWFWIMGYPTIEHPVLFTIFAIIGLIYSLKSQKKTILFLGLWFLFFFLVYGFFYAGSVRYGVDVRYSLSGYPPLIILGGYGMYFIHQMIKKKIKRDTLISFVLVAIVLISFYFYIPSISTPAEDIGEANQARIYHDYFIEFVKELDKNCYILSHVPSMYLVQDIGSLQTWNGQNEKIMKELFQKTDCIIFDDGFWCNLEPYKSSVCKHIFDKFELVDIASVTAKAGKPTYTFYKVVNPY